MVFNCRSAKAGTLKYVGCSMSEKGFLSFPGSPVGVLFLAPPAGTEELNVELYFTFCKMFWASFY